MKRLDLYLLLRSIPALVFGLLLYSTLVVISANIPRLQWVIGVPLLDVALWLALQFPAALVQTLPVSLLLAVLLTLGKLAADQELLALQAGGVGLRRICSVFLILALLVTAVALALNQWVLPQANARVGSMWWQLSNDSSGLFRLARQNVPLGTYSLFFASTDASGDVLQDVRLQAWQDRTLTVVFAREARFVEGGIDLLDYQLNVLDLAALEGEDPAAVLRQLVRADNRASRADQSLFITLSEGVDDIITRYSGGGFEDTRSISEVYRASQANYSTVQARRQAQVLLHRKLAEPFANLSLLLLALPLSLLYGKSRSIAFGLSLVVTLLWYLLLTLGQLFAQTGMLPTWLGMWLGNILLMVLGLYLLYKRQQR